MTWNTRSGNGLIENPPFVIPVQISQELNDFVPDITGHILSTIVNGSSKNQARALFQQLAESNQSMLEQLAQDAADVTEFYIRAENLTVQQVPTVLRNVSAMVVDAFLGYAVNQYPNEFAPVVDQSMANEAQQYIRNLEGVKREAQMFFQQGSRGNSWNNQSSIRGNMGGSRTWQPGNRNATGNNSRWDDHGGGGGHVRTAANDNWPGNNVGNRGGSGGGGSRIWDEPGQRRNATPADNSYRAGAGTRPAREFNDRAPQQPQQPQQRNVQPTTPNGTTVDGQLFIPISDTQLWPKVVDQKRIYDWILLENGTQLRPAHQSKWKVSFSADTPATPWYDPQTHILMHVKTADGTVIAQPYKREEAMEYLDHELDPKLRQRAHDEAVKSGGKVAAAWKLVENLRPNASSPLSTGEALGDESEGLDVRPVSPGQFVATSSLPDAIKRSILKLKMDYPHLLSQAFELYVDRGVLTTVAHPDFDLLFQVSTADSFRKVFQILIDSNAEADFVKEIDRRMVEAINAVLNQNMGLHGWKIEKFQEDFPELLGLLKADYGSHVVNTLEGYAVEVVSRALTHYSEEDLGEIRQAVGLEPEQVALVWRERSSITRLPVNSRELIVPSDTGVMVSEAKEPELFRTLSSIFERTEDLPHTYHGRYIATVDGEVYQLVRGYLNDQALLLFKAPFNLT